MFKFLHAADIHLDSPLTGLERYEGAPVDEIRGATRRALENLVLLACEEQVAFVLIAGDLYDGDWRDYRTGLFFADQMRRLREADIPVYWIAGNHDAANRMTKSLRLPENVVMLSHKKVQTEVLESHGVAIHGQGFATRVVDTNLAAQYPVAQPGYFNVGLLHTCATGSDAHEPYAPCSVEDLCSKQYDYWALGHVHQRSTVCEHPPSLFPGNIQGRHVRETGPKGCLLVSVDDQRRAVARFQPLDVFRWQHCHVDATGALGADEVLDRVSHQLKQLLVAGDGMPLGVRLEVAGACTAHAGLAERLEHWTNEVRALAIDIAGGSMWIEKIKLRTRGSAALDEALDGALGELMAYLRQVRADDDALGNLRGELGDVKRKLPVELLEGSEGLGLDDPEWLRQTLDHVQSMLVSRLSNQEGAR